MGFRHWDGWIGVHWESSFFPLFGVEPIGLVWLAIQRGELLGRNQNDMNGLDGILFSYGKLCVLFSFGFYFLDNKC